MMPIVLSLGPGVTFTKPYSARILRWALKSSEWPWAKGYNVSDQEYRAHCLALLRSSQVHVTILGWPSPGFCVVLFPGSHSWLYRRLPLCLQLENQKSPRVSISLQRRVKAQIYCLNLEKMWVCNSHTRVLLKDQEIIALPGCPPFHIHHPPSSVPHKTNPHFRVCIWEKCPNTRKHVYLPVWAKGL